MAATLNITHRNLTDIFVLMRNNSLQNKHIFSDQGLDDKVALVSSRDLESGSNYSRSIELPPVWFVDMLLLSLLDYQGVVNIFDSLDKVEGIEDVQYEMSRIRQKLQELTLLHEKHLTRPSLDDAVQEEKDIETITQDITRMFLHCKKIVHQIRERSHGATEQEDQISKNVLAALVSSLQDLSSSFHIAQSNHLRKLQSREERSQQFFDSPYFKDGVDSSNLDSFQDDSFNQSFLKLSSEQQQVMVENNTIMVEQREREIKQVVRSLAELNEIFRDLASMVADQGSVLDRIDYNLEQVQTQVHCGLQQLQKAERYHRKNRKMLCILVMAAIAVVLIIMLVIFKT